MKKLAVVALGVSGLAAWIGSYSTIICGCMDAASNVAFSIGAHPMKSDGATVRGKLLEKLPPGTSFDEVREYVRSVSRGAHSIGDPCVRSSGMLSCRLVVSKSMWREDGFEMRFALDAANRLSDAQVVRF